MQALIRKPVSASCHGRSSIFTGTRLPLTLADMHGNRAWRTSCRAQQRSATADFAQCSSSSKAATGLLGAAVAMSLLVPGAGAATAAADAFAAPPVVEVSAGVAEQQKLPTYQSAELSQAPDLVTDLEVESAAGFDMEAALANGIGWMVEGGLEVTNFTESNFAAVGAPSSSMWLSNSPWCLVWDAYCNVLTTQPVATKLATGMVGTFLGDMLAQVTQGLVTTTTTTVKGRALGRSSAAGSEAGTGSSGGAGFALDLARTARLVGFSALVGTPVAFVWFGLLDQCVMPSDPTNPLAVFSKVALDQVLMAPCMTSAFFATMAWLEGCRGGRQVLATVQAKLKPTLLANWTVWPLAHVINFAFVPPAQRILYINVINIAWTAFMSHMASGGSSNNSVAGDAAPVQQGAVKQQLQQARR